MLRVAIRVNNDAHARVGPLSLNVHNSRTLTDKEVREYMQSTIRAARGDFARVSLSCFAHQVPNAAQRKIIFEEMEQHGLPALARTALLTDSGLMRGALTAYSWVTRSDSDAFAIADRRRALVWLAERASFDVEEAMQALDGCFAAVGLTPR
ncbi:MAG: hypothetical protein IPG17_17100 [Sandaracinaceae bacterium]|nr:hypothetical protein [Sandaracinaceae bacterium]